MFVNPKQWTPHSPWPGVALIVIPALIVVAIGVYQLARNVPALRHSQMLVAHTAEVVATIDQLSDALQYAERSQRGFLITGDPAYLQPYQEGVQAAAESFAQLKQLTADNPEQQRRWPALEQQINIRLNELKRGIDARRSDGFEAAQRIVASHVGADAMQTISRIVLAAIAAEHDLLTRRQALGEAAESKIVAVSQLGVLAGLSIIATGTAILLISFRRVARSEQALRESESEFRGLLASAPDAMVVVDQHGIIVLVNAQTERIFGYAQTELVGKPVEVLIPARLAEQHTHRRSAYTADPHPRPMGTGLELFGQRKDGSEFPVEVSLSPRQTADGLLVMSAIRDISARKAAEAALEREAAERRRVEAILHHAQKMDALGQLASGIAHDLNNVLQAVQGGAALIERSPHDTKTVERLSRVMLRAASRGAAVTNRLLIFSRRSELRPEALNVAMLFADLRDFLGSTLGAGLDLRVEIPAELPLVLADKGQLETVLVNLATNARDAMAGMGVLTLQAAAEVLTGECHLGLSGVLKAGSYVRLSVADTGHGMDAATLARVTEPFFTTKPEGKGTGLGLAMAKGFAEQSGGLLHVESTPGQGTVVALWLPTATVGLSAVLPPSASDQPGAAAPARLLLVDDDEIVRDVLATGLEHAGFTVLRAGSGQDALALLGTGSSIDLLLSDYNMPGMNGVTLIREIHRDTPTLPAILLTGYIDAVAQSMSDDAADLNFRVVHKPVRLNALIARIEDALGRTLSARVSE